jgi:hypothetical protein
MEVVVGSATVTSVLLLDEEQEAIIAPNARPTNIE